MIDRFAVFSDETENFVSPYAPRTGETVTFKIRTRKKDFEKVSICFDDNTYPMTPPIKTVRQEIWRLLNTVIPKWILENQSLIMRLHTIPKTRNRCFMKSIPEASMMYHSWSL